MNRIIISSLICLPFCLSLSSLALDVQSEFSGPLNLKVWQHWQPSWNVEDVTHTHTFRLKRLLDEKSSVVELNYFKSLPVDAKALLKCDSLERAEKWKVVLVAGKEIISESSTINESQSHFVWKNVPKCLDRNSKNITQKISFRLLSKHGDEIFSYDLTPMYVRGKTTSYWNNEIDAYSAHAGSGSIKIATQMAGEQGWDKWNGTLVRPVLSFVDRNIMFAGGVIGLHRHEGNQEVYMIEKGIAEISMGVAARKSENYKATRPYSSDGLQSDVEEFLATGGWVEKRLLASGELAIIVPNHKDVGTVYFHGINAKSDLTFWTMGSRN